MFFKKQRFETNDLTNDLTNDGERINIFRLTDCNCLITEEPRKAFMRAAYIPKANASFGVTVGQVGLG